ncbi:hypothetical protein Tco_0463949, partial [Tanacetum coccineum]
DFKGMSYNDIRPIFEKVWDFNQNIKPMDVERGSEKQKSPEKMMSPEKSSKKIVEEEVHTQEEMKEVVKEPEAKRKKSIPKKVQGRDKRWRKMLRRKISKDFWI